MAQYTVVGRLMRGNKRVGFVVSKNGVEYKYLDADIRKMIASGLISELKATKDRFIFTDTRCISDLPIVHMNNSRTRTKKTFNNITCYTGDALKAYIASSGILNLKCRNFVQEIIDYCNINIPRVLSVSGLRGVGKTTGILQAITNLSDYSNCAYITISMLSDITCSDLKAFLDKYCANKKYIFIDEVTQVRDLITKSGFLSDIYVMSGKRIILSGTSSLSLVDTKIGGLYHRVIDINVTHISFIEARHTLNQTLDEYIQLGGLYTYEQIKGITDLRYYIDTAVVENIMSTLDKNANATSLLGLSSITDKSKLRAIVFKIVYSTIISNLTNIHDITVTRVINWFSTDNTLLKPDRLNTFICEQMNIDEKIIASRIEVTAVLDALLRLGLLIKVGNLANPEEYKYYLTNTSMTTQLVGTVASMLVSLGLLPAEKASAKSIMGTVLESIIVTHAYFSAMHKNMRIYFYRDKSSREIDIVTANMDSQTAKLFEVKYVDNSDVAVIKSRWIKDTVVQQAISSELGISAMSYEIVYRGCTMIFGQFNNKSSLYKNGIPIDVIEKQNSGVLLRNAQELLLDIDKYIS